MNPRFPLAAWRRHCGLALFLAASCLAAPRAGAASSTVDLEPHWKVGEHVDYVLTKHGVVTAGLQVQVDTTNSTPVRVDVLKADADGFVIGWTQGATQFDAAAAASMNPVMKKMAGLMVGRRLELRLDRGGQLQEVVNWGEVRDLGDAFARDVTDMLAQSGVDAARRTQAAAQIRTMFSSEQSVRWSATREVRLLLLPLGHAYDRSRSVQVDVVAPDPTGPGDVKTSRRVELKSGPGAKTLLHWSQAGAGASVAGDAVMDVTTGWAETTSQTVTAAADGAQRTETTSLQRK